MPKSDPEKRAENIYGTTGKVPTGPKYTLYPQTYQDNRVINPELYRDVVDVGNITQRRILDILGKSYYPGTGGGVKGRDYTIYGSSPRVLGGDRVSDTFKALSRFVNPRVLGDLSSSANRNIYNQDVANRLRFSEMFKRGGDIGAGFGAQLLSLASRREAQRLALKNAKNAQSDAATGGLPFGIGTIVSSQ